jgi:hypothetical protein
MLLIILSLMIVFSFLKIRVSVVRFHLWPPLFSIQISTYPKRHF